MFNLFFILIFLIANLIFIFTEKSKNFDEFVIEKRNLGSFKLFSTFLATNLSAFTIFGVSGAAYRMGWAFFPVMAFGTGFMVFSFFLFGIPLRRLAGKFNWITPSDFINNRFKSPFIAKLTSVLLLVFTFPYIAVQIGSAGNLLSQILNIPRWICSLVIIIIIAGYIYRGGMKSIVKTDILQLFILFFFSITALIIVVNVFNKDKNFYNIFMELSEFHLRNGKNNSLPPLTLIGYYILWFTADPVFPHLTQRFYSARSDKSLIQSAILYPIACLIIFFAMTLFGVIGSVIVPDLPGNKSDAIFTILLQISTKSFAPIFSIAAIAAIMSTLDSQLLSCASIISNDFFKSFKSMKLIKISVIFISILSFIISLLPISTILTFLTNMAFNGYASLFLIYLSAIYFPKFEKGSIILTILAGFILIVMQNLKILSFNIPFIFIILIFQFLVLFICDYIIKSIKKVKNRFKKYNFQYQENEHKYNIKNDRENQNKYIKSRENKQFAMNDEIILNYKNEYLNKKNILAIIIIFLLGFDLFNFYLPVRLILGFPIWVWYHIIITILLSLVFIKISRTKRNIQDKEMENDW